MTALELIAEQRIAEAVAAGELDALPGAGRPLDLDEDPRVPEERRMANRILRNAGYAPREVQEAAAGNRKLDLMNARIEAAYFGRAARRVSRGGRRAP